MVIELLHVTKMWIYQNKWYNIRDSPVTQVGRQNFGLSHQLAERGAGMLPIFAKVAQRHHHRSGKGSN